MTFDELPERLRSRIARVDGCWQWTGAKNRRYGRVRLEATRYGKKRVAHRVVYELMVGPVPEGRELDHLCRNTLCVNPAHLEPVTHAENVRRGDSGRHMAAKTHCLHGHPLSGTNLYVRPDGARGCRSCRTDASNRYRLRNVDAVREKCRAYYHATKHVRIN